MTSATALAREVLARAEAYPAGPYADVELVALARALLALAEERDRLQAAVTEWDAAITRADKCGWLNASRDNCDAATAKLRALAQPAALTHNTGDGGASIPADGGFP